jgi:hypothetical protein
MLSYEAAVGRTSRWHCAQSVNHPSPCNVTNGRTFFPLTSHCAEFKCSKHEKVLSRLMTKPMLYALMPLSLPGHGHGDNHGTISAF